MPRRSKVELSDETLHELENQFYSFLDSLSHEETKKFFEEFLTLEEKMMMYKRLALYWMLFEGYSLASIQRSLGVTHDTTRLYNKRKNQMSEEFKTILHRIGRTTEAAKSHEQMTSPAPKPEIPVTEVSHEEAVPQPSFTSQEEKMESMDTDEFIPAVEKHEDEDQEPQEQEVNTPVQAQESESNHEDITVTEEVAIEETIEVREEPQSFMSEPTPQREAEQSQPEYPPTSQNEAPFVSAEQQQQNSQETNDEEEKSEEKKKKGLGRFFGF